MKFQVAFVFALVAVASVFGQESAEQVRDKRAILFSDYAYAPAAYSAYAPAAYAAYAPALAAAPLAAPAVTVAHVAAAPAVAAAVPVAAAASKVIHSAPGSYAEYTALA